jgi:uncharacterized membrane protein YphA (DoxX/SURF4 family)
MKRTTIANVALWALQSALAALFLFAGFSKLSMPGDALARQVGLPAIVMQLISLAEVAGGLGLLLPGWVGIRRELTPMAAFGLILIMAGAVVTSAVRVSIGAAAVPLIVGLLLALVVRGRLEWASPIWSGGARPTAGATGTPMKFLSVMRVDERRAQVPDEQLQADMGKLIEEWIREGKLIRTAGLRPSSEGFRVRSRHGELTATAGPFTESREVIGGYAILEAKDREEAMELTKRFLEVHGDGWDIECEVRPLDGDAELGAGG